MLIKLLKNILGTSAAKKLLIFSKIENNLNKNLL